MAVNVKFDLVGNPEPPTIILAKRNGDKLGQLDVNADSIELSDKFNDASEMSFTLNKYVDGKLAPLWDKVVDFKLVWCKEWDLWFEIKVELDEATETVKTVFCTQLGQAELSQINLYDIHINEEGDSNWNTENKEYKSTILYDPKNTDVSLLHRLLKDKAPHYSILHVDNTIKDIQRTFSFDDKSIYDAFQEIAEEIGCLFVYNSNSDEDGKIQRTISVYDLWQNCKSCGHRGEFADACPKCGSKDIDYNEDVFEDTLIFVTSDELAAKGIQLTTNADEVKNCFKLKAGDDLMTATVRNCNPNGTDYIWRFSEDTKSDMSWMLTNRIGDYNRDYENYMNNFEIIKEEAEDVLDPFTEGGVDYYLGTEDEDERVIVGDVLKFVCMSDGNPKITYRNRDSKDTNVDISLDKNNEYTYIYLEITEDFIRKYAYIIVNDDVMTVRLRSPKFDWYSYRYNKLINKYKEFNKDLAEFPKEIKGYSSLMNVYYDVIDLGLYLESGLMPTVEMSDTTAKEQAGLLTSSSIGEVAVNTKNASSISLTTANSAVLSMAKILVRSTYKVEIKTSSLSNDKLWEGSFIVTNYSNEEDKAESGTISVKVGNDSETFIKQKIDKALNKADADDLSISGLFKKEKLEDFCNELKKYSLNSLKSFYDACDTCLNILIDSGAGNQTENPDLYDKLYKPYMDKSSAIADETKVRENELSIVEGVWDKTNEDEPKLTSRGLRQVIEEYRNQIQDALNFENYLKKDALGNDIGEELWLEFCSYRRDDTYSNDNYISDGLNNSELFEKALEFFKVAEDEIYKSSEIQHSISTSLNNLLAIDKFKPLVDSFKVGNWIRIQVDDKIFKLRLLEYDIDFGSFENISVEFSDVTKLKNSVTDTKSILSQTSSMASSYSYIKRQASQGEKSNNVLTNWFENGLDATQTKIVASVDENQLWGKNGFWCRQYDPITGEYGKEQIKIIDSTIAITDDNWNTTKTAIGKFYYTDTNPNSETYGQLISAYGVNGETIVGKLFIGETLSLSNKDNNLKFDDNGFEVSGNRNKVVLSPSKDSQSIFNITNKVGDKENSIFSLDEDGNLVIVGKITALEGSTVTTGEISGLANVAVTGKYSDLVDEPTKLSEFTNDSGFVTKSVNNLTNYYNKTTTDDLLGNKADVSELNDYYGKTEVDNLLDSKVDVSELKTVATSGSYKDLVDIEEFKTWISQQIQSAISGS